MIHTIMFIPVTLDIDARATLLNLNTLLTKKNISTAVFPEFDLVTMEQLLATNNPEDLLANVARLHEELANKNSVILLPGIPLTKPYAAELNFSIATALGAAVIFVMSTKQPLETALRQLKITANPYQYRYQLPILGCVICDINQNTPPELLPATQTTLADLHIPLLGTFDSVNLAPSALLENDDFNLIQKFLDNSITHPITPPVFKNRLIDLAKHANRRIVLPEGDEPRTIAAANICAARGIAQPVLLGDKQKIYAACAKANLQLHEKITVIEPQTVIEKHVVSLYELRRAKGMTLEMARTQLEDNVVLGTMMLHLGEVDGLVSGAVHTTANTIRPALQIIKTPPHMKLVSSIFFMCLPNQVLVYGDCALNLDPTAEELADIAIQSADSARAFGIIPKIAMLSYSTGTSGAGASVDKVTAATAIAKTLRPDLDIDGPLQYDAAISEETALLKAPTSKVAGHATVFIMPNLDVGNIAYKTVQRSTGIVCIGPMLQGLRKPVNDLSRGCSVDDIVFTIAVTAIQSVEREDI